MIERSALDGMKRYRISNVGGASSSGGPVALCLLALVVMFSVHLSGTSRGVGVSYSGRVKTTEATVPGRLQVVFDERGLEDLFSHWAELREFTGVDLTLAGSLFGSDKKPKQSLPVEDELFAGRPRGHLSYFDEHLDFRSRIYQRGPHSRVFAGPVEVNFRTELLQPGGQGIGPEMLSLLPREVEQVLVVDRSSLKVPDKIWSSLMSHWDRWEFDPTADLAGALGAGFGLVKWQNSWILYVEVLSRSKMDEAIDRRFPSSVIRTTARWSHGARILGFEKDAKPAWFFWSDYLVAAPQGGTDLLAGFLSSRFEENDDFRKTPPMLKELARLTQTQKGWHLYLIERSRDKDLHWALLLRWTDENTHTARGFLVLEIMPRDRAQP